MMTDRPGLGELIVFVMMLCFRDDAVVAKFEFRNGRCKIVAEK